MKRDTGSVRRTFPSSTIIITAAAVIGFDIEASRKMPSFGIGFFDSRSMQAVGLEVRDLAATRHQRDRARHLAGIHVALHGLADARHAVGREAEVVGLAGHQGPGAGRERQRERDDTKGEQTESLHHGHCSARGGLKAAPYFAFSSERAALRMFCSPRFPS